MKRLISLAFVAVCLSTGCASTSSTSETLEIASDIAASRNTNLKCGRGEVAYCAARSTRIAAGQQSEACSCAPQDTFARDFGR